ncbi:hypothetical protein ACIQLJ_08210 [Microbacterium sp. NPDC091313]
MSETLSSRPPHAGRIVLDTFRSAYDPMLQAWLRFRAHLLPEFGAVGPSMLIAAAPEAARAGQYGVWRMLATNNRELARGSTLYASPAAALTEAEALQRSSDALTASVIRAAVGGKHGWVLRRDGVPALMCSRWFESAPEAAIAARAARAALGGATLVRDVSIGTRSGRRHRHETIPADPVA